MDSALQDAAPLEGSQPNGTSQVRQIIAREIADSDAESDDQAMDIDDEKPKERTTVDAVVQNSGEAPEETVESFVLLEPEETAPLSFDTPTVIQTGAREASIELGMGLDDKSVDKSLEHLKRDTECVYDKTTTSELPQDNARRFKSPDLPSAGNSTSDSVMSAPDYVLKAPAQDSSGVHEASLNQPEVDVISASSFSDQSSQIPSSDAPEDISKQEAAPYHPQVELTPEQKRIVITPLSLPC